MQVVSPVHAHTSQSYSKMLSMGWNGPTEYLPCWGWSALICRGPLDLALFFSWGTPDSVVMVNVVLARCSSLITHNVFVHGGLAGIVNVVILLFRLEQSILLHGKLTLRGLNLLLLPLSLPYPLQLLHLLSFGCLFC